MTAPAFTVEGARQLRRTMKAAGISLQDLKDAHREAAELVKREAEPNAPRRNGTLAASMRAAGTQSAAIVRVGGARVPYAGPIHWGWEARHIAAQPWVAEAAEDTQPSWEQTYLDAVQVVIATIEGIPGP